jgi:paraquat-inducible protein B
MTSRSRNRAIFSIVGVVSGAWLLFRSMSPKGNEMTVSDEERESMRGGDVNQTTVGNKTARAPERGLKSP